jgi:succinate dehydrogenase (ubiquinone) iron-sulfur subunit
MNPKIPFSKKLNIHRQFANLPRNSALSRVRNRCIFTGRSRGVYKKFKVSRMVFRSLASNGLLPGVKKASW